MQRSLKLLTLCVCVLAFAACNTVKGVGKDIKKAGEKIEEAADKHD